MHYLIGLKIHSAVDLPDFATQIKKNGIPHSTTPASPPLRGRGISERDCIAETLSFPKLDILYERIHFQVHIFLISN